MKIIQEKQSGEDVGYVWSFDFIERQGVGFGFAVDYAGRLLTPNKTARENYRHCIKNNHYWGKLKDQGIREVIYPWVTSRIGRCDCGEEVFLDGFTNTCDKCGRDYDISGNLLAPRSQWGEETGESWMDII